ncbi:MAG TPA: hypothetical protein VNI78_01600 [Vicinamibacterales bacterium]|nr:hypothetical protein [Vicinamibacterales bacterium]
MVSTFELARFSLALRVLLRWSQRSRAAIRGVSILQAMKASALVRWAAVAAIVGCLAQSAAFAQALATYRLGAGWATFGIALPRGAAYEGLQVGSLPTQTDVKTRWPDGSIRFAIVSARVASEGKYPISRGPASGGAFTPTWPAATVQFRIAGSTYRATLPPFDGQDSWLAGPLVRESRVVVAPAAAGTPHPLVQVIFDVRSYADGAHRVDVTVQNVKDIPGGNKVVYEVEITLNGAVAFRKSGVSHAYLTRWRKTFPSTGLREAEVTPDVAPFIAAGLVPQFAPTVDNAKPPDVDGPRYDILTWGDMSPYMPAPGGRPEIGFYPYWTAQYLVHRTQAQREYMLKHADLSGSWSGHITEADGRTLVSLDRYPDYWLDPRSIGRPNGPATLDGTTELIENAHMPSLTYVPYLITGDRYYLDQTKLWANFAMLATWPGDPTFPRTGLGVLTHNQIRGIAWGLRALGEAATAAPDTDPDKAYFTARVHANLEALDAYSRSNAAAFGPLELVFPGKWGTSTGSYTAGAMLAFSAWQNQYVAWALDNLGAMGFSPVAHLRDRVARFWVRLFTSEPDYPRPYAAPGVLYGARLEQTTGGQLTVVPATTMRQLFCDTF